MRLTEGFESGDEFVIARIVEISLRIRTRQDSRRDELLLVFDFGVLGKDYP